MARPRTYAETRVDTKVRLRQDHVDLLRSAQEERGLGRNKVIEMALDAFFGIKSTAPKLQRTPVAPDLGPSSPEKPSRTSPRLQRPAAAMEAQSAARTPRRTPR